MGIKQLYNDNLRKLPNEYGDVSVMVTELTKGASLYLKISLFLFFWILSALANNGKVVKLFFDVQDIPCFSN